MFNESSSTDGLSHVKASDNISLGSQDISHILLPFGMDMTRIRGRAYFF